MIDNVTPHPDPPPQGGRESRPGWNDNRLVSRFKGLAILLVVAIGAFYAGSLAEFQLGSYAPNWAKSLLFYTPPKANIDYRALDEVFTTIQQHYVKPNADGVKLTEGAAAGMVGALGDQFSRYLTPEEYRTNQTFLAGQFAGIGASVQQKADQVVIASILPGTPAEKAGLHIGDVIIAVDGQSTKGWTADNAVNHIRGQPNTQVQIQVNRNGQTLTFNLTRQEINVPSVATHIFDNRVLYVRIFEFGNRTATEFDNALKNNLTGSVNLRVRQQWAEHHPGGARRQGSEEERHRDGPRLQQQAGGVAQREFGQRLGDYGRRHQGLRARHVGGSQVLRQGVGAGGFRPP